MVNQGVTPESGKTKDALAEELQSNLAGGKSNKVLQENTNFAKQVSSNISTVIENLTVENDSVLSDEQEKILKNILKTLGVISTSQKSSEGERKKLEEMFGKMIAQTDKEIEKLVKEKEYLTKEIHSKDTEVTGEKETISYLREEILDKSIEIETLIEEKKITEEEAKKMREEVDEQIAKTDIREEQLRRTQRELETAIASKSKVESNITGQTSARKNLYEKFPETPVKKESAIDFLLGTVGAKEKMMDIVKGFLPGLDVDKKAGSMFDTVNEKITGSKFGKVLDPFLTRTGDKKAASKEQIIAAQKQKLATESIMDTSAPIKKTRISSENKAQQKKESLILDDIPTDSMVQKKKIKTVLDDPLNVFGEGASQIEGKISGKTKTPKKSLKDFEKSGAVTKNEDIKGELIIHTKLLTDIRDSLKQQTSFQKEKDRETDLDQNTVSNNEITGSVTNKNEESSLSSTTQNFSSKSETPGSPGSPGGGGVSEILRSLPIERLAGKGGRALGGMMGKGKGALGRILGRGGFSKNAGSVGSKVIGGLGRGSLGRMAGGLGKMIPKSLSSKIGGKILGKGLMKGAGKAVGKSLLKKIPGIGLIAGAGFGLSRLLKGDITGAFGEVLSGVAGTVPGIGTAASTAIDAGLAAKDGMSEDNTAENSPVSGSTASSDPSGMNIGNLIGGSAISKKSSGGLLSKAVSGMSGLGKMAMKASPIGLALAAGGGVTSLISNLMSKNEVEKATKTAQPSTSPMNISNNNSSGGGGGSGNTPVRIQDNSFIRYQDKRVARV